MMTPKEKAKQTAVEWLISEIQRHNDSGYEFHPKYNEKIIEQAKEMEKQQIMDAVDVGFEEGSKFPEDIKLNNAKQYYNETFKSE